MRHPAIVVLVLTLAACGSSEEEACSSDDECGSGLVCDRPSAECVAPPTECVDYCANAETCDGDERETCVKSFCGASFLGYYGEKFGSSCQDAWLALMGCNSSLSCDEWREYTELVDPETGVAPYCEAELQAKNAACEG